MSQPGDGCGERPGIRHGAEYVSPDPDSSIALYNVVKYQGGLDQEETPMMTQNISLDDVLAELRHVVAAGDIIKGTILLNHFDQLDAKGQNQFLVHLAGLEGEFYHPAGQAAGKGKA